MKSDSVVQLKFKPLIAFVLIAVLAYAGFAQASPQSLDLTFTVTSQEPPSFSSSELAAGQFVTGPNQFDLTLSNPAGGQSYTDVALKLSLIGLEAQTEVKLECQGLDGSWALLTPTAANGDLIYTLAEGHSLEPGRALTQTLRLSLGASLRDQTIAVKVEAYSGGALIAGAEKTYSLSVAGPAVGLGPQVPQDSTFGIGQATRFDLTINNSSAGSYSGIMACLAISGVPDTVQIAGEGALAVSQDTDLDGKWELVSLNRDSDGSIVAWFGPVEGITLSAGETDLLLPLQVTWPEGSAGSYAWAVTLVQGVGTEEEWPVAEDDFGIFTVARSNPAFSVMADEQDFGSIPVNTRSTPITITITNTGNVTEKVYVQGTHASGGAYEQGKDFYVFIDYGGSSEMVLSIAQQFLPKTIAPGESLNLRLFLKPKTDTMAGGTYRFSLNVGVQVAPN